MLGNKSAMTGLAVMLAAVCGCAAPLENNAPSTNGATIAVEPEPPAHSQRATIPVVISRPPPIDYRELVLARSNREDAPSTMTVNAEELPEEPTKILDPQMAERLFGNSGITLQWIGWEQRGPTLVAVSEEGYWMLLGGQRSEDNSNMEIEGFITEIGADYFLYDGTIKVFGTPDQDRQCNVSKRGWRFAITQNREYWRLREFEWCDGLTDYIDIYF